MRLLAILFVSCASLAAQTPLDSLSDILTSEPPPMPATQPEADIPSVETGEKVSALPPKREPVPAFAVDGVSGEEVLRRLVSTYETTIMGDIPSGMTFTVSMPAGVPLKDAILACFPSSHFEVSFEKWGVRVALRRTESYQSINLSSL